LGGIREWEMNRKLDKKLRQMYEALGALRNDDIDVVKPKIERVGLWQYCSVDFSEGVSEIELENKVTLLIANIASLKDHIRAWCSEHGVACNVEDVLNTNRAPAIVHDLWNIDKHGALDRKPRSGVLPKLVGLTQVMELSTGTEPGAFVSYTMDPRTGKMELQASGGASASLVLHAEVQDEAGNDLGSLVQLCEEAVGVWESCIRSVGAPLPK
jgi:hypothetical protein